MRDCVDRFGVGDRLRFDHAVDEARWDEAGRALGRAHGRRRASTGARCWCGPPARSASRPSRSSRAWTASAARCSTRPSGSTGSTSPASGCAWSGRVPRPSSSCRRSRRSSSTSTSTSARRRGSCPGATGPSRACGEPPTARCPAIQRLSRLRIYATLRVAALGLRRPGPAAQGRRAQDGPRPSGQAGARRGAAPQADPALRAGLQAPAALRRLLPLAHPAQRGGRGRAGGLLHRARGRGAGRHRPAGRRGDHGHRLRGGRAALRRAHRRARRRAALRDTGRRTASRPTPGRPWPDFPTCSS